jgi:hypothetical protein
MGLYRIGLMGRDSPLGVTGKGSQKRRPRGGRGWDISDNDGRLMRCREERKTQQAAGSHRWEEWQEKHLAKEEG